MFQKIGNISTRLRWPIVIGWIALAIAITLLAPNIDDVASSDASDFIPANAPFRKAYEVLKETFPDEYAESNVVIVVEMPGGTVRDEAVWAYMTELTEWLQSDDAPDVISDVLSPASGVSLMADAMISDDGEMGIILINLSTDPHVTQTEEAVAAIRQHATANAPEGINVYLTGDAPIILGYTEAAQTSIDRTVWVTIALVVLILIAVYRSPVSPIVPLLTVAISYLISRGIVAWLGATVMTITTYANVLLVVILFGAGTDYCLFLISRFREELANNGSVAASAGRTVKHVGETITSSAGTVIVGFVSMMFAEMGLFRTTGPALAIGVVVVLLAGLTLTPALLSLLGQKTFWPGKAAHRSAGKLYAAISSLVSARPILTIVVIVAVLAPLAIYATGQRTTYDMLADLPEDNEAREGYNILASHMGGGEAQPLNIVIRGLDPDHALAEIDYWTEAMLNVEGVADVRSLSAPMGLQGDGSLVGITRVDRQLALFSDLLGQILEGDQGLGGADANTIMLAMNAMPLVFDYLNTLESRYPQMAGNEHIAAIRELLNGLPTAALSGNLERNLTELRGHLDTLAESFAEIDDAYYIPDALPQQLVDLLGGEDPLVMLTSRYLTEDRTAARFEVILAGNPFGDEASDVVTRLRQIVPGGAEAISGYSAAITDLRDTMQRDTLRSFSFVLFGIFIVLVLLLRALASPIYLILTILLSYGATIGITRLFSELVFGTDALTWWVPFFMFVMLVALGMDYNIFLMGRVKEEVAKHGVREGVHQAVAATGPIISSAGIIMAGTFGAMMAGVITGLSQLGLAVAVGVLLDTFVIRTALVPAIAVLLDKWNWWPAHAPGAAPTGIRRRMRKWLARLGITMS